MEQPRELSAPEDDREPDGAADNEDAKEGVPGVFGRHGRRLEGQVQCASMSEQLARHARRDLEGARVRRARHAGVTRSPQGDRERCV